MKIVNFHIVIRTNFAVCRKSEFIQSIKTLVITSGCYSCEHVRACQEFYYFFTRPSRIPLLFTHRDNSEGKRITYCRYVRSLVMIIEKKLLIAANEIIIAYAYFELLFVNFYRKFFIVLTI